MPTKAQLLVKNTALEIENKKLKKSLNSHKKIILGRDKEIGSHLATMTSLEQDISQGKESLKEILTIRKERNRLNTNINSFTKLSWFERAFLSKASVSAKLK